MKPEYAWMLPSNNPLMYIISSLAAYQQPEVAINLCMLISLPELNILLRDLQQQEDATECLTLLINTLLSIEVPILHEIFGSLPDILRFSVETMRNQSARIAIFTFTQIRTISCHHPYACQDTFSFLTDTILPLAMDGGTVQSSLSAIAGLQSPSYLDRDYRCRHCNQKGNHAHEIDKSPWDPYPL
jgi:hypothetical protein